MNELSAGSDSSEDEFGTFFKIRDTELEKFAFENINISYNAEERNLSITFRYSFCQNEIFSIALYLDALECIPFYTFEELSFRRICFSIGMCCLPWLWMGFGTPTIVISKTVAEFCMIDNIMLQFWQEAFRNIIAEYQYLNKAAPQQTISLVCNYLHPTDDQNDTPNQLLNIETEFDQSIRKGGRALVPLGGTTVCALQFILLYRFILNRRKR